jgi:hypothetical protein
VRGKGCGLRSTILISAFFITHAAYCAENVQAIIQRSVAANQVDWKAAPDYSWTEEDRTDQGDHTYRVRMIDGSPWRELIKVNGVPLSTADFHREQEKLEAVTKKRNDESHWARQERIAKYERDRQRDHLLMDQLTKAFAFSFTGDQTIGGRDVYVLRATPLAGYNPPNKEARVLTGMEGKLWIDKESYQWVKVTAQVIHPVSIIGFFARVEPGTDFELDKSPVAPGIWLPTHFSMKASSRILSIFGYHTQDDETYSDYKRTT